MTKKFNSYEIAYLIGHDILSPVKLDVALKKNSANFTSYEYRGFPMISLDEMQMLLEWRKKHIRLNDIMPNKIANKDIAYIKRKLCARDLVDLNDWKESLFKPELGPFIAPEKVNDAKDIVNNYLTVHHEKGKIKISTASLKNNISKNKLIKVVKNKQIASEIINGRIYINKSELNEKINIEKGLIQFEDMMERYALDYHLTLTPKIVSFMRKLMVENEFYGLTYINKKNLLSTTGRGNDYYIMEIPQAYYIIAKLMRNNCNKMIYTGNLDYFITLISDKPKTYKAYQMFLEHEKIKHQRIYSVLQQMQILCELVILPCEVMDADDDVIEEMLTCINGKSKRLYRNIFNFLVFVAHSTICKYQCANIYYMEQPVIKKDVAPYPADIYMRIAYMVFNADFICKNQSLDKAINNSVYAQVWLYVAMHYFAMWRRSDILDLPLPIIEEDINNIIKKVQEDNFSKDFYERLCDSIVLQTTTMVTNKTGAPLVLDIPLDLVDLVGKILLVCECHRHSEGRIRLIESDVINIVNNYEGIFGTEYTQTLGGKLFSNRRANKSYANAIVRKVEISVDKNNKVMGYMIASYARSHKGSIDSIAPSTMYYLDYKSDGLNADQFLMEMFATGACGFMLDVLLDWVIPSYNDLSPHNQSILSKMLGLSAYDIDKRISGLTSIEYTTNNNLDECIKNIVYEQDIKSQIELLLTNIASRNYTAKERHVTCLRTASDKECVNRNTDFCTTCKFALFGRMYVYELAKRMQKCDYYAKNSEDKLVIQKNIRMLDSLKSIYRLLRDELIKRYQYSKDILNNIISGGELDDSGK